MTLNEALRITKHIVAGPANSEWEVGYSDWEKVTGEPYATDEEGATLTCVPGRPGWRTDSGCEGYFLPKKVVEAIVMVLRHAEAENR